MDVIFTKTTTRRYDAQVERDGVVLSVQTFDRPARLPHDIAHVIVENGLMLKYGFWGLIAAGVLFSNVRVVSGRLRARAAERSRALLKRARQYSTEAEILVSVILEIAELGLEDWQQIESRLKRVWQPAKSQRSPLHRLEVMNVCCQLRDAERDWKALPIGGTLRFVYLLPSRQQADNIHQGSRQGSTPY